MAPSARPRNPEDHDIDRHSDPHAEYRGILLGNTIQAYIDELDPPLIENASPSQIKPASYDLRLGDRYYQDGSYKKLTEDEPVMTIKPHGMVVVSTLEILHMPRYLIGRWNMRVGLVYHGLLWAGGPQVDPGYYGQLFCPLYNLSSTEVVIRRHEHIFTIDFEKTTDFVDSVAENDPEHLIFHKTKERLEDFVPSYVLKSSVGQLEEKVKEMEETTARKVNDLQSTLLVGLSIVFAGLTIVATLPPLLNARLTLTF